MSLTSPDLAYVITNEKWRKGTYAGYVIALLVVGATQIAYGAISEPQPDWLTQAVAVVGYLGVPVGALALANTKPPTVVLVPADKLP